MSGESHPVRVRGHAWKWWVAVVLFLATVLTYLDRQTVSLCGPMICDELKLSNEEFGRLLSSFRWAYAFTHVPAGFMADHLPLRGTYGLAVLVWSAAGAAAAGVWTLRQLLMTRAVLGVGEAFNWPCATRIVANMLPPQDRGLASGIFNSGSAAGSLLAPLLILPLAHAFGWRTAFVGIGSLGVLWIILWLVVTRRGSAAHEAVNPGARRVLARSGAGNASARGEPRRARAMRWVRQVLLHPAFWMLLVVGVSVNPCWYFLNEWVPKYMRDQRGMSYLSAGMISVPVFIAADLGNLAGGALVKLLALRGWSVRRARGTATALAILLIMPAAAITRFESAAPVIGVLCLAAFGITSILANYTACQQDFSFAHVGAVAGILGMACNVFSACVNPLIGRYVDRTGNYHLIFLLLGLLPCISLVALLIFDALISPRTVPRPR